MAQGHVPVLLQATLDGLALRPGSDVIDGTLGGAGHAVAILEATSPNGRLLALDADGSAVTRGHQRLTGYGSRVILAQANFDQMAIVAGAYQFVADAVLLDLGLSSYQLDDVQRGFSFQGEGPLDMRFDRQHGRPAADLVNTLDEASLADLIYRYGEDRHARRIARAIVRARPLTSTQALATLIERTVGASRERIHPATRTFQALRIAVNDELGALERVLPQAVALLRSGGRLAVISFHSLEDRVVKQFMQREAQDCICPPKIPMCVCGHRASLRLVTRKPVTPTAAEVADNPRSRSARLRIAEKLTSAG